MTGVLSMAVVQVSIVLLLLPGLIQSNDDHEKFDKLGRPGEEWKSGLDEWLRFPMDYTNAHNNSGDTEYTPKTIDGSDNSSFSYNNSQKNSTISGEIKMENSTTFGAVTQENSAAWGKVTTEYSTTSDEVTRESSRADYLSTENSTKIDDAAWENSTATVYQTMENSTFSNDIAHGWPMEMYPDRNSQERSYWSNVTMESLDDAKMAVNIWLYGSPVLIVAGTFGNLLSFAVMLRKKIRNTTTSLYLLVLSVADTVVLYTGLLRMYIKHSSGYDIRHSSALACKFHLFGVYACQQFDSWVLVSVTLERVCAVFVPYKSKEIFTKQFATLSLVIQALVIIIINSNFFYTHDLMFFRDVDGTMEPACVTPLQAHLSYISNVWPWIDFCLFSLVPFIIILTSNVAIVCRLLWSRYVRRHHLHATHDVKMSSMTAILLTVSIVFFVTTAPISIFIILSAMLRQDADVYQQAFMALIWAVLNMILYTNNAVNFLLYCVSGPRFRRELKVMFRRGHAVHPANNTTVIELQNG